MILDLNYLKNKYKLNITGVIHVGAHFGEENHSYNSLGIKNKVYFEPIKKTYENLKKFCEHDSVLFNLALGNTNGLVDMFVEDLDAFGAHSILKPGKNYANVKFSSKETVNISKLDDINFDFSNFNFLNIDTQGYEFEVLLGAEKTLNNIDYIMCEVNRATQQKDFDYIGSVDISVVHHYLNVKGFTMVECNWAGGSWGDAFFTKNK